MDSRLGRDLEAYLLELLEPAITPKKALQLLSSPRFAPEAYAKGAREPVKIFFAYMKFIMIRQPDGCMDGIWEDIFKKTVSYSRNFRDMQIMYHDIGQVATWLCEALSTHNKCPNPYVRLELFRLIKIFSLRVQYDINPIQTTFMHTICEIQPHHLYTNEILFGIQDLEYIFSLCNKQFPMIRTIISNDFREQVINQNKEFNDSEATRFLCNCIQLIGVFVVRAGTITETVKHLTEISRCCGLLTETLGSLVDCGHHLNGLFNNWDQFRYIVSLPPFRHYVIKTIGDLTAAITSIKPRAAVEILPLNHLRHLTELSLDICNKTYHIDREPLPSGQIWNFVKRKFKNNPKCMPRLLLGQQVQGFKLIHQYSLLMPLLEHLTRLDNDNNISDVDDDDSDHYDTDSSQNGSNFSLSDDSDNSSQIDSDQSQSDSNNSHSNSDNSHNDSDNMHSDSDF